MVIVPGFGAFISEYQPAEVDNESDEIKPPSSRLVFNPQIKNNDGLLVGYVAEATRSSHFEALQKIEKERDNMLYQLDKGEKVELIELGTLYHNEKNELVFESLSDKRHSLESFGLEATSLKETETEESLEEDIVENEPTEEVPPVIPPAEPINEESELEENQPEEETSEPSEEQEEPQSDVEEVVQDEAPEENEEEKEEEESAAAVVPPIEEKTVEEKEEKKRKGGWIWLLVILIPLIAVSVFILIKDKKSGPPVQKQIISNVPEEKPEPVATIDTTIQDSVVAEDTETVSVTEEFAEAEVALEESGPKFYLIGGSFKEEENAETYLQELKAKGYEPFHLGKYGSFYIVGIGTFKTEEEALAAKQDMLDKNPGSGYWVLEK